MKKTGTILALLLLLATVQSTFYFLGMLKVKFIEWLIFNACAPSNIVFLVGFALFLLLKNRTVLYMAILPMFFFGALGLFVFSWNGMNVIPQIGHVIMILNIAWLVWVMFKTKDFKAAAVGLLLGAVIFLPFIGFQQNYVASHPEDFQRIMLFE